MTENFAHPPWEQPGWFETAEGWIRAQLESQRLRANGAIETLQTRPWSILVRVPTEVGTLFFKAIAPSCIFEAALTAALAQWEPDCIPQLVAADVPRGWLLFRESGARLREVIRATRDGSPWLEILPRYARLQKDLAPRREAVLAFGTPDHRLEILPQRYEEMLANVEVLRLDQPNGLSTFELEGLTELAPQFAEWCKELGGGADSGELGPWRFSRCEHFSGQGRVSFY